MRRLVGCFSHVEWQGGVVMSAGESCIELCGSGQNLHRKNWWLRTSTRPLEVLM